jgi:pantoate kinase
MKLDAKTVTALAALVAALAGGVELRVQVGLLSAKIDRIEAEQREVRRELQNTRLVAGREPTP